MKENPSNQPKRLRGLHNLLTASNKKRYFENLIFRGGGVRGIAYIGALAELEKLGIMDNIKRVGGSSVGAIAALVVSLRLPLEKIEEGFSTLNFSRIPQTRASEQPSSLLNPLDFASCSQRLTKNFGWYSSEYFYEWLKLLISEYTHGKPMATFSDLKALGYRELYVVVSNLTKRQAEVLSVQTTPNVAVADAIRMSMSIPLYFEAMRFNGKEFGEGDIYVDGGFFDNYPVHIFDTPSLKKPPASQKRSVNLRTLGLFLYSQKSEGKSDADNPTSLIQYINLLMGSLYSTYQLTSKAPDKSDLQRTIRIGDCGVSSTDFNIKPGDEKFIALYESGQNAVRAFFAEE